MTTSLRLLGAPGSPYTRKMRALLRYRRIPFRFVIRGSKEDRDVPEVPVPLIPVLVLPGEGGEPERAMIDSTFQLRLLEERVPTRRVVPSDPVLAFVDALIEDYADEWLTKAMFHYRWAHAPDIEKASRVLPRWSGVNADDVRIERMSRVFAERQIGRLGVVGSSPDTAPLIEGSYRRLLAALDAVLSRRPFVLGDRPGSGDFALFGQLTQLVGFDPTPAAIALSHPRVIAWIDLVEDLSGLEPEEPGWVGRDAVRETAGELLAEIGRVHAPFLLGNERALESGAPQVECEIDGGKWVQKPFPYQGKCLRWLRERRAALSAADRAAADALLAGTGCEALFRDVDSPPPQTG